MVETSPTGYGNQTDLFGKRLAEDYDFRVSAFYGLEGRPLSWDGYMVLPGLGGTYGNEAIPYHVRRFFGEPRDGLVLTLMDVWVLDAAMCSQLNMACWVPVDHDPAPPRVLSFLQQSGAVPIAMSRFGEQRLTGLDPIYVPHAVDTSILRPIARAEARKKMGVDPDAFLVGIVAANKGNPSRKCFSQALEAFAFLRKRHEDAQVYLHTDLEGTYAAGVALAPLIEALGIPPEAVGHVDPYAIHFHPVATETMAVIYSAMDVLLNPSAGEGFGIPVLEAQACFPAGTPISAADPLATYCRSYTGPLVTVRTARGEFEATVDHPVWTSSGWRSAGDIRVGDRVLYCPDAAEGQLQVHRGAIDRVVDALRDAGDIAHGGGGAGRYDAGGSGRAATDPGAYAQALLGPSRDEAVYARREAALLPRGGSRRRGNGHDQAAPQGRGTGGVETLRDRLEYGRTADALASSRDPYRFGLRRLPQDATGQYRLSVLGDRARLPTAIQSARTGAGTQGRPDGSGYRMDGAATFAGEDRPPDESAARDRVADPRSQYEAVTAIERRDVRDLPVYNLTTKSGTYLVGAGYLVHNCGTPVIVTDFSSMPELVGAGWKIDWTRLWTPQGSWQVTPDVVDLAAALEHAYCLSPEQRESLSRQARQHAVGYDVRTVYRDRMVPALEKAWERFEDRRPVEVAPEAVAA